MCNKSITDNKNSNFMKAIIIIPARMGSSRFPNKPLADINGKPMIIHVADRAKEANIGEIYIACAEKEIADIVQKYDYNAILTNPDHPSGTDRIYEAIQKIPNNDYEIIVNVQGDLPTIEPHLISDSLYALDNSKADISTLVCKITDDDEIKNPNIVKALVDWSSDKNRSKNEKMTGDAYDFSRDAKTANDGNYYHHIGLYAYRKDALTKFINLEPSEREISNKLEQLRALDNGMKIEAIKVETIPIGVDTPEDLEKAKKLL